MQNGQKLEIWNNRIFSFIFVPELWQHLHVSHIIWKPFAAHALREQGAILTTFTTQRATTQEYVLCSRLITFHCQPKCVWTLTFFCLVHVSLKNYTQVTLRLWKHF